MKLLLVITAALAVATCAFAGTYSYGWEDGTGTIMGSYGNIGGSANVTDPVYAGGHALYFWEDPIGGTPQAYVAFIEGCLNGDVIDASFFTYDDTPGGSPSVRIWAHYTLDDIVTYKGSAGGNETYPAGTGWEQLAWSWLFETPDSYYGDRNCLVIEARIYSGDDGNEGWVDNIVVTAPDHCTVTFAGEDPTGTNETSWGQVKSLFR